jgi:hypothetical protein
MLDKGYDPKLIHDAIIEFKKRNSQKVSILRTEYANRTSELLEKRESMAD